MTWDHPRLAFWIAKNGKHHYQTKQSNCGCRKSEKNEKTEKAEKAEKAEKNENPEHRNAAPPTSHTVSFPPKRAKHQTAIAHFSEVTIEK